MADKNLRGAGLKFDCGFKGVSVWLAVCAHAGFIKAEQILVFSGGLKITFENLGVYMGELKAKF